MFYMVILFLIMIKLVQFMQTYCTKELTNVIKIYNIRISWRTVTFNYLNTEFVLILLHSTGTQKFQICIVVCESIDKGIFRITIL